MSDPLSALRSKLASEIPVTLHLGLEVLAHDEDGLILAAPLAKNVNHEGTAFAGSVNAVATLAGWGWVWLALKAAGQPGHVVLQDSKVRHLAPIDQDFRAYALQPSIAAVERLLDAVRRHGRGRIGLTVEVRGGERLLAEFEGRYVAYTDT
jgi:thioesterase domain-containing protein